MKIDNKSDEQVDIGDYTIYYTFDDNYDGDYGIQRYYYGIDNSGRNINDVNIEFLNRNDGIAGNELAKITFPSNMVNANGIVELKMGVYKQNWSNFDENSHYSYGGTSNQYIFNDKVVVVKDGSIVFGIPKPDVDYGISKKLDTLYIPPTAFQKFIKPRLNYNDDTTDVRKAYYNDKIVVKSDYTASQLKSKIALFTGLHLDSITVNELYDDRKIVSFTVSQTIDSIINNMTDLTIEKDYVVVPQMNSNVTDSGVAVINDTHYEKQFLHSKYHTPKLWNNGIEKSTKIALFDTGVDPSHPDLEGSILSGGLSFVSDKISEGDENSIDENGHGTIMSCIITAKRNNSFGIAGINDSAKILPIKIIGSSGYGSASDIAKALYYIADETDIKLINMSIGTYTNVSYLQEAVDYAVSKGVVIIASSGNEGGNTYVYPAAYPNVISVGAVDRDEFINNFKNSMVSGNNYYIALYQQGQIKAYQRVYVN